MTTTNGDGLIVTLNGEDHKVVMPPDHATRWDLAQMLGNNAIRGSAAVLGVCCPSLRMPALSTYQYNVGRYSAEVIDLCASRGITPLHIIEAATPVAVELQRLLLPGEESVADAVGFSSAEDPQSSP